MKKLTVLLIALVLVCSSVFATVEISVGNGFGLNTKLGKEKKNEVGVDAMVGLDFILNNNITIYNDFDAIFVLKLNGEKVGYPVVFDKLGVGYTFKVKNFEFMAGAGPDVKVIQAAEDAPTIFDWNFGANLRMKATYFYSNNCGVFVQASPAFEFAQGGYFTTNAVVGFTFSN